VITELGGLHAFMGWNGPILTDSGGFQVFSLRDTLLGVTDDAVTFRSVYDGEAARLTPEDAAEIQRGLGSDVAMCLDVVLPYVHERKQFGQSISKFQLVSSKIVDMKVYLETARYMLYHGAYQRSQGRSAIMEAALAKLHISDCWVKCCEEAIQIHGGYGYMTECEVERELRDAIASRLFSGTSEIQRNIIASLLL